MAKTIPILTTTTTTTTEVEGAVQNFLLAVVVVVDRVTTFTRTATPEVPMAEVVVGEDEEEAAGMMEISRITRVWTTTAVVARNEAEMATTKAAGMVNSNGIEVREETTGTREEEEEEDRTGEVVVADTEEAVAGDHGVGNNEEIVEDVVATVIVVATST
eukprot:jgi/Psemu1/301432/fgenesh1_kg.34_\